MWLGMTFIDYRYDNLQTIIFGKIRLCTNMLTWFECSGLRRWVCLPMWICTCAHVGRYTPKSMTNLSSPEYPPSHHQQHNMVAKRANKSITATRTILCYSTIWRQKRKQPSCIYPSPELSQRSRQTFPHTTHGRAISLWQSSSLTFSFWPPPREAAFDRNRRIKQICFDLRDFVDALFYSNNV